MSKDPAFLFYSSDFLTGVSDLTFEERGQYITLLCLQHQKGRLSKKAIDIAVPNAAADVLAKFSEDENGLFFNERLEVEADKRKQHAQKQRQRALDGWKKRKAKESGGEATVNAAALPLENESENVTINNKRKSQKFKKPTLEEITEYAKQKRYTINPNSFFLHYESNGWMVGKNKMKNWKTALSGWQTREDDKNKPQQTTKNPYYK